MHKSSIVPRLRNIGIKRKGTACAAFYPSITLSGELGWSNNGGTVNPSKLLWQLIGSLSQPIFARGQINANYKTSKLTEENLKKKYVQAVVDAGNEVNEALADCQAAREKHEYYHRQVEVLNEASNMYNGALALISLYIALGGGTK